MTQHANHVGGFSRRDLLLTTLGSATALSLSTNAVPAEAAEADKVALTSFDKIEPQKYPWGWIRWLMNAEIDPKAEMTLGIVYVEPNQLNPLHIHPNSAEYLHVLAGACEHLVGDRWVALKAGDTLRVPKGVAHQARTTGQSFRALLVYDTGKRQMVPVEAKPPK
jgi:quercetin dioxygenase-like cupin family protein